RTFNLDYKKLEKVIKQVIAEGKLQLKAIIAVDLFGLPANYTEIRKIANKYNLLIIEDGAQGFGGSINSKKACSFGDISTTSFFPAKPLGCYGDGGAIFTDNDEYYELIKSFAVHGKGSYKYDNVRIGYNSRLDTIQAGILLPKLKAFKDYELADRNKIAQKYTNMLKDKFVTPLIEEGFESSWAQYTLILNGNDEREKLQEKLKQLDIPTMVYYPIPMHKQTAYKGYNFNLEDLKTSEELAKCVMSIPMHPYLNDTEQSLIIESLLNI
ncbi:MAG: DegT/DnrJ/EryC1/StrS family aminotransferase, partial [Clostridia bacterium]